MEAYFTRNLLQISAIFWLSVFIMIIGFGIIVWGVIHAINNPEAIAPAILATGAGIITEFIGATFLLVYRSAIKQAGEYAKTLERINAVGMASIILDSMPNKVDGEDLKNKTKAKLVEMIFLLNC
jgi:hypothetical protein